MIGESRRDAAHQGFGFRLGHVSIEGRQDTFTSNPVSLADLGVMRSGEDECGQVLDVPHRQMLTQCVVWCRPGRSRHNQLGQYPANPPQNLAGYRQRPACPGNVNTASSVGCGE
jgi:hypothetical protein